MDSQFNYEDTSTFESTGFMSDESENESFEEIVECNDRDEESYLTAAIKGLDDSLCTIDIHL